MGSLVVLKSFIFSNLFLVASEGVTRAFASTVFGKLGPNGAHAQSWRPREAKTARLSKVQLSRFWEFQIASEKPFLPSKSGRQMHKSWGPLIIIRFNVFQP